MKCDICKSNESTIHIQEVINNNIKTIHICEDCAKNYGFKNDIMDVGFNLYKLFSQLSTNENLEEKEKTNTLFKKDENSITCPECGISYNEFLEIGKLGCGYCYVAFKDQIKPILRRIHGTIFHKGKIPFKFRKKIKIIKEIKSLNNRLKRAVKKEKYEEAVVLRDKIKSLSREVKK